ncbi:OPT oligopeptide transporter [Mycena indigotica]|uniref:OPT oligopeptide transporter n=1 Tax=Mycena indigotica TaxID=2126181 RepID=A0A8H6T7V3_9AGAR|nr:OPT oligopeptide transporter [Mycena indigotica]KAF7312525.1 OPT oligopeptide transporter [Mycena indigotica]
MQAPAHKNCATNSHAWPVPLAVGMATQAITSPDTRSSVSDEKHTPSPVDEKGGLKRDDIETANEPAEGEFAVLDDERDIATHVIMVEDDESLNPWTVRAFVLGLGLSAFGGVLAEIYYFKPQTVLVSTMFLAIIAFIIGKAMEMIPAVGPLRYLNPHPWNKKENAMVVIMASAAANSALATEVLAVQRLFYNLTPNPGASIFLLFSSQLAGYGIGGLFRHVLLYPSKMLYPGVIPLISMLDALFKDAKEAAKKKRLFWIAFAVIFFWEILPEWMFPLLTGFSIFCLANPRSQDFTRIFGGSNGNEGLGLLSICFDWQYISAGYNPMAIPLKAQFSNFIGYVLCMVVFVAVYYNNIWNAKTFPFVNLFHSGVEVITEYFQLSQELFYANGSLYDQLLILDENLEVDPTLLAQQGLPFYASTWVVQLLVTNLGMAATFTHLLLWNRSDLRAAWSWATPSALKASWATFNWRFWQEDGMRNVPSKDDDTVDPHYREMLKYPDAPNSWYFVTLLISIIIALVLIYKTDSTLPWWGLLVSLLLGTISIIFFGALYAITGLQFIIQPFVQMIGGFIHPGKPVANMYFVLFSYNSVIQAQLLLRDLKIAQYTKLPPRAAFTAQILGTLFGAVLNFVLMNSIIDAQRPILLSVEGTNIWSGQQPQQYNSQAIAWGGLSHQLFALNQRYEWVAWAYVVGLAVPVPFWIAYRYFPKLRTDYLYTPVICYYIGWLCVGINSSVSSYFVIAYLSQWWLRTRYPRWFTKYNYVLAAALDGGTQVMVFILSFAVQGASGNSHLFPQWWGANQNGNYDRCAVVPSP